MVNKATGDTKAIRDPTEITVLMISGIPRVSCIPNISWIARILGIPRISGIPSISGTLGIGRTPMLSDL